MPITHINHQWHVRRDTGATIYEECPVCHKRQAWQRGVGATEAIDRQWIQTGTWSTATPAHKPQPVTSIPPPEPIESFQAQRKANS